MRTGMARSSSTQVCPSGTEETFKNAQLTLDERSASEIRLFKSEEQI